jgi:exopolyphosphatase/guanosine-5'-triphosphate,3'-diphosphate pyrophosphatase
LAIATAACRDAKNGRAFIKLAERIIDTEIDVLSGAREAELTALGVISGVHQADGVVGDLGGGSLELVDVYGTRARRGLTRPLGGLALADISAKSLKKAEKFVKKTLSSLPVLKDCEDRTFYAVGGTWRSLARLHMWQTGYPLHVMHGYAIAADEALEFAALVHRVDVETLSNIEVVAMRGGRCLPMRRWCSNTCCASASRGRWCSPRSACARALLYSLLKQKDKEKDALIEAARDLNQLRSRSPRHGEELIDGPTVSWRPPASTSPPKSAACVTPRACWPISAGARIPIIAASNRSTSSLMAALRRSTIRAAPIWRSRCSTAMSGWSWTTSCRRGCASLPRPA